jgi:hypothetical protein
VNVTTIDDYCASKKIATIQLLKCDTEGHDMEVLRGAETLFCQGRIMVCQFEYNHRWVYSRHFLKDVFDFCQDLPYLVGKVTPGAIEVYKEWHPELEKFWEGNYVLVHETALRWFSVRQGSFGARGTFECM